MNSVNDEKLQPTFDDLQKQADEYLTGWKRAKADLINLQKDVAKERVEWAKYATAKSLLRLLPAIDTLSAAAAHSPDLGDTVRKFEEYLKGEGMTEIDCSGKYDHDVHEVIGREKREGVEPDTIVIVAQKGYKLHDHVLRPAKVIIAE